MDQADEIGQAGQKIANKEDHMQVQTAQAASHAVVRFHGRSQAREAQLSESQHRCR